MDPGAGRTVYRIMVFAATVHLCFMLISPCQRRRTVHTRDPAGRSQNLLNSCLGSLNSPRERHRPHLAIADKVRYTPALQTRPALLAAGPTLLLLKELVSRRSTRSRARKCSRNRSISGPPGNTQPVTPIPTQAPEDQLCLRKRPLIRSHLDDPKVF